MEVCLRGAIRAWIALVHHPQANPDVVMALPRPTSYAPRSQAFSPCCGSDYHCRTSRRRDVSILPATEPACASIRRSREPRPHTARQPRTNPCPPPNEPAPAAATRGGVAKSTARSGYARAHRLLSPRNLCRVFRVACLSPRGEFPGEVPFASGEIPGGFSPRD
jgi:hypothetical protein